MSKRNRFCRRGGVVLLGGIALMLLIACGSDNDRAAVDALNDLSYAYHYVSLDSTFVYADKAWEQSERYSAGRAEALNNIAFVELSEMSYDAAEGHLSEVLATTDNQLERLVANVQMMRLCQRMSRNKEFYTYYWAAKDNCKRICESRSELTERQERRFVYADTEMKICYAAYLYYMGQMEDFRDVLSSVALDEAVKDTAQLLNYLYNIGSGGYLTEQSLASVSGAEEEPAVSKADVSAAEFIYLVRCYFIALRSKQIYWQANALQAMSEHLLDKEVEPRLLAENELYIRAINDDEVPDSLMAGNFAQRSLNLFIDYGDTYQTAGALRTLSDCYFQIGLYDEAILSLDQSLTRDTLINQAPALTSSIYERLSINYSAVDNKPFSDYFRNLYLDTQENTRQDYELDVRAEQLDDASFQLNLYLLILLALVVVLFGTLYTLVKRRGKSNNEATIKSLLEPLEKWKEQQTVLLGEMADRREEIAEQQDMALLTLEHDMQVNVEQRAKVSLINSITPLINRIIAEIDSLKTRQEDAETRAKRFAYIGELNAQINKYNDVLTEWIQLRKGELNLKIETFPLQEIFDILDKSKATFAMQDIRLDIKPTSAVVKADRALTLFMLNTIADNARKAVEKEGEVIVEAGEAPEYVEIAIKDNGKGMAPEQMEQLFTRQSVDNKQHGFGLMNCKGIIEKYKKVSNIFSICGLSAESEQGKGTTLRFRLPHGVMRIVMVVVCLLGSFSLHAADVGELRAESKECADSAYFCNLQGRYEDALAFAEDAYSLINEYYRALYPHRADTLALVGRDMAELQWANDTIDIDYSVLLDVRNETAVAALALHEWDVYSYNNQIYTQLFRELSTDHSLPAYVKEMQAVSDAKNVAIILLIFLLISIIVAYYFLYYRHKVIYRSVVERVKEINAALFEDVDDSVKLDKIRAIWQTTEHKTYGGLNTVVEQIISTLEASESIKMSAAADLETATDELNKIRYESECLHVSNNVLDNCLSALKHETMYYPSKLEQLLSSEEKNIDALEEVAQYYRALFTLLSMQAQTQVEGLLRVDDKLKEYLKNLLLNLFDDSAPTITQKDVDDTYEAFTLVYPNVNLSQEQVDELFMPLTGNIKCLLVRQIVREMGEATNRRACGIKAASGAEGLALELTLAKEIQFYKVCCARQS